MATVTKRGNVWRARVWRRGYQPQHATFDTRVEADAWARGTDSKMDRHIFVSRAKAEVSNPKRLRAASQMPRAFITGRMCAPMSH